MSATFDQAIPVVLTHEGGWVDNPADAGRETNFGISSLIIAREKITAEDLGLDPATPMPTLDDKGAVATYQPGYLKPMTVDAAKGIYKRLFWDRYKYEQIDDQTVATKIFDACVNMGQGHAHPLAQAAANDCNGWPGIAQDGVLGPASMAAINTSKPVEFIQVYADRLAGYYQAIVSKHPSQRVFLRNWLKRASWGVQP